MSINCIGYSYLTVADTAIGLSSAVTKMPDGTQGALMTLETATVRWRADGTAPTSTTGHLVNIGDVLTFDSWTAPGNNWKSLLSKIKFIRTGGTSGELKISWFD
jgi:hypothetical protein